MPSTGASRILVTDVDSARRFDLRLPLRWAPTVFIALWLGVWILIETSIGPRAFDSPESNTVFRVWFVLWSIGGPCAAFALLWLIRGHEVVVLTHTELIHRYEIGPLARTRRFVRKDVQNLRVDFEPLTARRQPRFPLLGVRTIAFEYAGRTKRIAARLNPAEAEELAAALLRS